MSKIGQIGKIGTPIFLKESNDCNTKSLQNSNVETRCIVPTGEIRQ